MMPFLLAEFANLEETLPLYVYCAGNHEQHRIDRPQGYPAHQIFLCRSGTGIFRIHGRPEQTLPAGSVLLLPADTPHSYTPASPLESWDLGFVAFNGKAASSLLGLMGDRAGAVHRTKHFAALWEQLEALWQLISLNGENATWEASRRIYSMAVTLLESWAPPKRASQNSLSGGHPTSALQTAVRLMHTHYSERLLVSNLARAAGYSVQHFHRLFVAEYHVTPQQYLLQLRMRRSVQLFTDFSGISVEEVAQRLGMETSYFIRMFKRFYGSTPKQYIKRVPGPTAD
ncbi:AraC family transcriptional regulator [Gorillibacterium sp. sgz5001074]|uniref:AraC family transcriptional regulator n=1 Tax=Gorillibacterium sp. sgz5001074 TaxID=3446695 RepID=UPI003F672F52